MLKLARQQEIVYRYILANRGCLVQEIRDATKQRKPDMRISEINYAYQLKMWPNDVPNLKDDTRNLIVNVGRNEYREVKKAVRTQLTRTVRTIEVIDGRAIEKLVQVPV